MTILVMKKRVTNSMEVRKKDEEKKEKGKALMTIRTIFETTKISKSPQLKLIVLLVRFLMNAQELRKKIIEMLFLTANFKKIDHVRVSVEKMTKVKMSSGVGEAFQMKIIYQEMKEVEQMMPE